MSNDPYGQSVIPNQNAQDNTFPTTTMETVVGDVKVSDKSDGIGGQVVDSTHDTPIDVNALHNVQLPPGGLNAPVTNLAPEVEKSVTDGEAKHTQENPEQTFLPHDTMNNV